MYFEITPSISCIFDEKKAIVVLEMEKKGCKYEA